MADAVQEQLRGLAQDLRERRESLLQEWRELIDLDPQLTSYKSLGRRALDDHIPRALDNLERRLRVAHDVAATEVELQQVDTAAAHATQRWQFGYDLRETLREWGHLSRALLSEVTRYCLDHPEIDRNTWYGACLALSEWTMDSVAESGARYVRFHQAEAANRLRALRTSMDELQKMENERASLLREAAHDLRGSAAVVANVSALLERPEMNKPDRQRFYSLLQGRIGAMGALLTQLMTWAQLETGQDKLQIESFDAAERIQAFCDLLRPVAEQRSLFLKAEGAAPLNVETDPIKLQRILQNLLLNAIRATEQGGVTVRWTAEPDGRHWTLAIQDTGPGFNPAATAVGERRASEPPALPASAPAVSGSTELPQSEGIGLLIVERLCEALEASLKIDSAPGAGTTIRITLPLHHAR
jgi:signal transduction histidine kinase